MQGIFEKSILRVSGILRNLHIFFILGLSYNKKKSILPYLYPLFFGALILHLGCTLESSGEFEKVRTPGCYMRDADLPGLGEQRLKV